MTYVWRGRGPRTHGGSQRDRPLYGGGQDTLEVTMICFRVYVAWMAAPTTTRIVHLLILSLALVYLASLINHKIVP